MVYHLIKRGPDNKKKTKKLLQSEKKVDSTADLEGTESQVDVLGHAPMPRNDRQILVK